MLSVRTRQTYLKALGFYKGAIDGIVGPKTKAADKALQKKYFVRSKDIDGIYGNDTEILLVNAYYVKKYTKNFKLTEFKCGCGGKHCTGYPAKLSAQMLKNLQAVRDKYGPVTVTYCLRCKKYNATVKGSSKESLHIEGKAVDHAILPKTNSEKSREEIAAYERKLTGVKYVYHNKGGKYPHMGNAIHMNM